MTSFPSLFFTLILLARFHSNNLVVDAVKCLDCVGENCMGNFCEGDVCVMSHYAPRWGNVQWANPQVVKGCLSGKMVRKDIRSHCEAADAEGDVSSPINADQSTPISRTYSLASATQTIAMGGR
jgi:hypothetical protein